MRFNLVWSLRPAPKDQKVSASLWVFPILAALISLVTYRQYAVDQKDSGAWGCEMSWMTPSYRLIDTSDSPVSRYKLYLYREAQWDDHEPTGSPVIFVPGNAGSYAQVRSIASSASRQYHEHPGQIAQGMQHVRGRDFFTVDYNEEFSAFHGPTVRDQAHYLAYAVRKVLELYRDHSGPSQVTLLGHSMGGIVARLAAIEVSDLVDVIFTMSTPHLYPPVALEWSMESIYNTINSQSHHGSGPVLLSICGGVSDTQIVSDACSLTHDLVGKDGGFAVFTTGIPGAWTGVDHQAMVWCHQVRWRVARVLLEMTQFQSRADKLNVARSWLWQDNPPPVHLNGDDDPSIDRRPRDMTVLVRRVSADPETRRPPISIEACDYSNRCELVRFEEMTSFPAPMEPDTPFPLPGEGVKALDIAYAMSFRMPDDAIEIKSHGEPGPEVTIGAHVSIAVHGRRYDSGLKRDPTHLTLRFPSISLTSLEVFQLDVELGHCKGPRPVIRHRSMPRLDVENTTSESRFFPLNSQSVQVHSHIGDAPFLSSSGQSRGLILDVYQDPSCPVKRINVSTLYLRTLAKAVLRYRMMPIAWSIGWSALLFCLQLQLFARNGVFPSFAEVLSEINTARLFVGCCFFFGLSILQPLIGRFTPTHDWLLGVAYPSLAPLSSIFAIIALGLVIIFAHFLGFSRVIVQRFQPTKGQNSPEKGDEKITPDRLLTTGTLVWTASVLVSIYLFVPQQLALVALYLILGITYVSERPVAKSSHSQLLASIMLLLTFILPFNLVTLGIWARTLWLDWRSAFSSDHNILRVIPLLGLVELSSRTQELHSRHLFIRVAQACLLLLSLIAFLFGGRHMYILPYLVDPVLLCLWGILWP